MYRYGYRSYGNDPMFIWILLAFVLASIAQGRVHATFRKYSKEHAQKGLTASEVARDMLQQGGITDVQIERVAGNLTDHYDPKAGVLRLSEGVHDSTSIAALGVAAHEVGHVFQHYEEYAPLKMRSSLVPFAQLGSFAAMPLFILGLMMSAQPLVLAGIIVFAVVVLFYVVTLPVEFNASSRALIALEDGEYLTRDEVIPAKKVLNAAGLTYVTAALQAFLQLLRLVGFAGRRRD